VADSFERLKSEFLAETEDTLANLQRDLRDLEPAASGASQPEDVVDRVFRTTHSLKGVAGMFGLDAMSALAHSLENVLDGLRDRRFPLDPSLLDLLYRGQEGLHALLAAAGGDEGTARASAQAVIDDVAAALRVRKRPDELGASTFQQVLGRLTPEEADGVRRAAGAGRTVAIVELELPDDGFEEPFRALLAAIRRWGTVHGTVTTDRDAARRTFRVCTATSSDDALFALIREVAPLGAHVAQDEPKALLVDLSTAPASLPAEEARAAPPIPGSATSASPAPPVSPGSSASSASPARPSATTPPEASRSEITSLRVSVERVDRLLFEVGELVQAKVRLDAQVARALGSGGDRTERTLLKQSLRVLDQRIRALRDVALGVRTLTLEPLFRRLERVFREACRVTGKDARFESTGDATELDKSAVEALAEPLVHLVRNAVDHGLDSPASRAAAGKEAKGTVRISARAEGSRTLIEVQDDGAGVDFDKVLAKARRLGLVAPDEEPPRAQLVDLLFHPGVTVKDTPTAISGRGVGLDVVRDAVARVGGLLDVDTGKSGTTFRLRIPTSLTVVPALEVESQGAAYFLPLANVVRVFELAPSDRERLRGEDVVVVEGSAVPTRELAPFGEPEVPAPSGPRRPAVLLGVADRRAVLLVDRLGRQRDIVVRGLGDVLGAAPGVSGCAELGDGRTVLVLDPAALVDRAPQRAEAVP
jgi:two-component system chemotaxis sensor kinase CheA